MPNRAGARGLVFGGLMAALTAVIVYLVPFPFVYPLPLTLVYIRYGARSALTTGAATALLLTIVLGGINGLVAIPSVVLPALAMGYGVTQRLAPLVTITASSAAAFVAILTNLGLTFLVLGQNPVELFTQVQVEALERTRDMMQAFTAGANDQMVQTLDFWIELMPILISRLLPALLLFTAVITAMCTYWVARLILPRFGHKIEPLTPFVKWSAPIWLSWAFIGALGVSFLAGRVDTMEWAGRLALNIAVAVGFVYLVIGVAVAYQWLSTRIGKGFTILLLVLGYLYVAPVLLFVGMWDGLFDFRKLRSESQGGNRS